MTERAYNNDWGRRFVTDEDATPPATPLSLPVTVSQLYA